MDDRVPAAAFIGMPDPVAGLQHIEARLPVRPPCAPPAWIFPRQCRGALHWCEPFGRDRISMFLTAYADRVGLGVCTTAWTHDQQDYALLMTVATLIIDQYTDQNGPPMWLHTQPYDDRQMRVQEGL